MKWLQDARARAIVAPSSSHRLLVPRCDNRSQAPATVNRANTRVARVAIFSWVGNVSCFDPACASVSSLAVGILTGPCQHESYVIGLLAAGNPVRNGAGDDVADAGQRLVAMGLDEFNQPLLAEFAEFVFGFG